ncbi:MAG: NUDIX hydrolase [Pontibacterium sp.]
MLSTIKSRLSGYQPRQLKATQKEAGVMMLVTACEADPHILLTQRSSRLSSHSGEVAFPGGKRDVDDVSILDTALRETEEEIGLHRSWIDVQSPLSQLRSLHGLRVTPWVGLIAKESVNRLTPSPEEIDSIFQVPLTFFLDKQNQCVDDYVVKGKNLYVPAWRYESYIIWGLTAYFIAELVNLCFDADIPVKPRPEHKLLETK